ncbi:YihY/virulence factor BrkB family protein [Actinomyces radicidentis]|uniref:YihY/virulence factor BrkB family protein n=1 Tax=Actinomyces radicidentis TaxID=111015 RepID=UPI000AA19DBB|nr:YihY/virulence factor BrkB family protein [Actinomyces radicidentis]
MTASTADNERPGDPSTELEGASALDSHDEGRRVAAAHAATDGRTDADGTTSTGATTAGAAKLDVPVNARGEEAGPDNRNDPSGGVAGKAMGLVERYNRSRLGRLLSRYGTGRGGLIAGGIAYTGLFSTFAALAIGISFLMATIGRNPDIRDAVITSLNSMLPGVIDDGSGSGLVTIDDLTVSSALNIGSIIAILTLIYSAMGLMGALKSGVRAMFGIVQLPQNPVMNQVWNLTGFLVIMVSVAVTALASIVTNTLATAISSLPSWIAGPGGTILTLAVSFVLDAATFALIIWVCGVRPPRKDYVWGSVIAAIGFGVLRQVGTSAVGSVSKNPLLASFAAIIVLVLWLHLAARVVLYVSAWMANPPRPQSIDHPDEVHANETPNYVTLSVPETLAWPRQSLSGTVEVDTTAHPDYVPPVELDEHGRPAEGEPADVSSLGSRVNRWRYNRARKNLDSARRRYLGED